MGYEVVRIEIVIVVRFRYTIHRRIFPLRKAASAGRSMRGNHKEGGRNIQGQNICDFHMCPSISFQRSGAPSFHTLSPRERECWNGTAVPHGTFQRERLI